MLEMDAVRSKDATVDDLMFPERFPERERPDAFR
jgi:hypothetical protein